ncbi:hypothetical protein EC528_02815 [Helicobacter pylori]|nr:hypothetical protein EC528_02815 [Helicobacter pylori]
MFFTSFKKWGFKTLFYRFSSRFIVKTHFLKVLKVLFYFLENIESALKPFSLLFNLQLNPPIKKALFKNYRLN